MAVRVLVVDDLGFFPAPGLRNLNATGDITVVGRQAMDAEALS